MKLRTKFTLINLFCLTMASATAQTYDSTTTSSGTSSDDNSSETQYIINWAALLGYNIAVSQTPTIPSVELTDYSDAATFETLLYSTFLGSIPTTTSPVLSSSSSSSSTSSQGFPFVPSQLASYINNSASNLTFANYGTQSSQTALINASTLVDQPPFQSDPVTQYIFNILGTPDVSYCVNSNGSVSNPTNPNGTSATCSVLNSTLFQNQIVENVIGTIPDQNNFYTIQNNTSLIPQLNSNSLIAPLNYSPDAMQIPQGTTPSTPGLTATTQAQLAANFIRYVSGSVNPTLLPNMTAYQTLYSSATNPNSTDPVGQAQAQAQLSTYLTNLRVYAAQSSVGISNLYFILSRRLPQQPPSSSLIDTSGSDATGTTSSALTSGPRPSQALNEYNMATWRIFQPESLTSSSSTSSSSTSSSSTSSSSDSSSSQAQAQWIDKINSASPAAVQKEIAILLAEINYQLYLDRQIQERMLFTSSVSLLQGTKAGQPDSNISNINTSSSSTTSSTS